MAVIKPIAQIEAFVRSGENLLSVAIVSERNPIAQTVRTALVRELVAADQLIAHLRDGYAIADCADLYREMAWNHKIVRAGCAQLTEQFD